jgi:hypothetical protein
LAELDPRQDIVRAYQELGTISGAARAVNADRSTVRKHLKAAGLYDNKPLFAGRVAPFEQTSRTVPKTGIKRYILTCAQNNTKVNQRVWDNLLSLAEYYDAEVMVSTFTYNKASYGAKSTKKGRGPTVTDIQETWYDPEVEQYICDDRVELAPGLVWCGEMNILPTAVKPLQGLEVYTERASGIFPHVKVQMASIASGKHEATKFNYTTGTVTKRNYIQKKEGLKAEFHHVYGGLIVEVDTKGRWYVRQLTADSKGVIYDLDVKVDDCDVTTGHRIEAITWGDIHTAALDQEVAELAWGDDGMLETLQPKYQFMHDILDFLARNGHTAKKGLIHDRFQAYMRGHDSVEQEIGGVATFLDQTSRDWCETVVVDSNHDAFMMEWLRIGDYRADPVNAIYFLEAQLHVYASIALDPWGDLNLLRWAVQRFNGERPNVRFLNEDESFVVKDIEQGMHGHRGPNGARGTAGNLARMGRKMNRGHEHSAGIFEGVYTSGLSGQNDQGYNKGPSSWSASHIVTYANGKRAIYTMWGGKWRA